MSGPPTAPVVDLGGVAALRADLAAADFTVAGVEDLLGPVAAAALHREQAVPALRATEPGAHVADPRAVLVRLLLLGGRVPRRSVEAALPTLGVGGAERLGLVTAAGHGPDDDVRARVDLQPYAVDAGDGSPDGASDGDAHWWLASDLGELATGRSLREDHVLGVGGASATLARLTVRDRRRRALDLGTGCGVQALHASLHCDAVVATDVSTRALAFARFNAALAGVGLDLREGSLLEPVEGETFDLVVSNPPFVITPRGTDVVPRYEYRDGGRAGDDLVRRLVTGLGDVLAPGGVAQMLGNWEHRRGEDWAERVGSWLDASGLDGWVVQREVQDPAEYAELWLRDGGTTPERDPAAWRSRYEAWLDDFAARDVEAVGFGFVVLRRPTASSAGRPRLRRVEERPEALHRPLGPHLAAVLAAHDRLAGLDDDALARRRLVVAPDVTEERHGRPGAPDPAVVLLRQGDGFGRTVRAGTALAGLVGACDGEVAVGPLVRALAALLDVPGDALAAELLPQVRGLVLDGLLLDTDDADDADDTDETDETGGGDADAGTGEGYGPAGRVATVGA